jgi:ParB family transcriptional regulator, chromosome partitioning protein
VRDVLGEIDLDPASCNEAQVTVKATRYFTKADDGLKQEWWGRIFVNPPYKRGLIRPFVRKLIEEYRLGRVSEAILLSFNNTSAAWFQEAAGDASAICFTRGNIAFFHKTKGQMGRSAIGAAFLYFSRGDINKFVTTFSEIGLIVIPYKERNDGQA